jgi:hypothetical protein
LVPVTWITGIARCGSPIAEHSREIGSTDGLSTRPVLSYEACSSRYASAAAKSMAVAVRRCVSWLPGGAARAGLRGTRVGLTLSRTVSASITTLPTSVRPGRSYIVLSSTSSRIARRPRAPVPRSSAWSAIGVEAVLGELELDVFELEHLLVLLDQRVLRLGEDLDQRLAVELRTTPTIGRRPMNSGIMPNLTRSSGSTWANSSPGSRSAFERTVPWKPTPLLADAAAR